MIHTSVGNGLFRVRTEQALKLRSSLNWRICVRERVRDCSILHPLAKGVESIGRLTSGSSRAVKKTRNFEHAIELIYFRNEFRDFVVVVFGAFDGDELVNLTVCKRELGK